MRLALFFMMQNKSLNAMRDLFDAGADQKGMQEVLADGAVILRGFALDAAKLLLPEILAIETRAPFRHMTVPGGHRMSVAITNCGKAGWVSDSRGYRYDPFDPDAKQPWPPMPDCFAGLAARAAAAAGFNGYVPDACLINRYAPGARVSLHQDKNERDFSKPIVSVSLCAPAVFLFGGLSRKDRPQRIRLTHGDVVVWGGPARLAFHGVAPLKQGATRINLTFRKAL